MTATAQLGHDLSEDCHCGPETVPVERADGSMAWLYVHRGPGEHGPQFHATVREAVACLRSAPTPLEGSVLPSSA